MSFKINSNKESYEWDENGIYGELYVEIEGIVLPFINWTDIVGNVLSMWIYNLIKLLKSDLQGEYELHFMDGPYYLTIIGNGKKDVDVVYYVNDKPMDNMSFKVDISCILNEVLNAIRNIVFDERLKNTYDYKTLEENFRTLEELKTKII